MLCDRRLAFELLAVTRPQDSEATEHASTTYHLAPLGHKQNLPVRIKDIKDSSAFSRIGQRATVERLLRL